MSYDYPKVASNSDKTFGPTLTGHYYIAVYYHNKTARRRKNKGKWNIQQNEQFEVFRISDEGKWFCKVNNGLFSLLDGGKEVLGNAEERLAYFVKPNNNGDPWHGYPVFSEEFEISEDLLDFWVDKGIISPQVRIKIGKGQL
jgi:hypothetical protein